MYMENRIYNSRRIAGRSAAFFNAGRNRIAVSGADADQLETTRKFIS